MADLAVRDELPLVVVRDVSTWPGAVLVCIAAAVYLGWSTTSGRTCEDLELIASGVLLGLPLLALIGSREIRLYENWIVVIRRGTVRIDRSLDELVAVRTVPFANVHWAVFSDSARVLLFSNAPAWRRAVDHCKARLRARGSRAR
jgi:hypothetical protein